MNHNHDDDPTLTPEAVADRLGVSPSCVYKEIDRRRLPAHRLGQGNDNCCCKVCRQKVYTARSDARQKKKRLEIKAAPPQTGKYEVKNPAILNFLRGMT
jgi:excisionase family DNA binding protein